ncbi:MAG TPA: hypothetical protein VNL77_04230 [Roseiflexaceae bacterium]|nr:hypothetical protein [Roseiflexaceae bacterium]
MHQTSPHEEQSARIEGLLLDIQRRLDIQSIAIAQIQDELAASRRRDEWYHVQFSQMLRVLARDTRELRATLICSLLSEGPVSAQTIQALLRQAHGPQDEPAEPPRPARN